MLLLSAIRPLRKQLLKSFKKLALVLATFVPVTESSKEDNDVILNRVLCIYYPLRFCKDKKNEMQALINSVNKINAMTPAYASSLGLRISQINIEAQKIDNSILKTFGIVIASF